MIYKSVVSVLQVKLHITKHVNYVIISFDFSYLRNLRAKTSFYCKSKPSFKGFWIGKFTSLHRQWRQLLPSSFSVAFTITNNNQTKKSTLFFRILQKKIGWQSSWWLLSWCAWRHLVPHLPVLLFCTVEPFYQCLWFLWVKVPFSACWVWLLFLCTLGGAQEPISQLLLSLVVTTVSPNTQDHQRVFLTVLSDSLLLCVIERSQHMMSQPALRKGPPSILNNRPLDTQSPSRVQIQKTWRQLHIHLSHSATQGTESERQVGKLSPKDSTIIDWIMI